MSAASTGPWLGLVPYSEDDRGRFYGRGQDTLDLLKLVRREVLTVLFGRSGSGKSSLLKAGLFPKLREERFLPIWLRLDHSGKISYGQQIREAIAREAATHRIDVEIVNEPLADEAGDFWEYLHRVVFWDARNQPVTPVLFFDQFEELFTLGRNRAEIADFLEQLADVVENRIPGRVRERVEVDQIKRPASYDGRHYKLVVTLREDFVSRLDGLSRDMPSVMRNRYALTPMNGEQALEAVLMPGGDLVTPEAGETIVRFVSAANETCDEEQTSAEPMELGQLVVEPALLSLVCSELNLLRLEGGRETIALEQVRASGDQIIWNFYERSLDGLDTSDRAFIEDRLVTASGFRTAVPVEDAVDSGLAKSEISTLIDRRLLRSEDRLGIPHIELTHDVLTKVVVRSRQSRREREEADCRRLLEEKESTERDREAKAILREKKAYRARRARWIATGVAAVLAVMTAVAWKSRWEALDQKEAAMKFSQMAGERRKQAEAASLNSDARSLALNAVDTSRRDPELALLLSIESAILAFGKDGSGVVAREIELALRTATRESLIRKRYEGHSSQVYSVDFDATGTRLVTGSWYPDGTARVWDVATGHEIARLDHQPIAGGDGKKVTVSCARFSPDGRRIVTATYRDGGHVYIWDAEKLVESENAGTSIVSTPLAEFRGHSQSVTAVAFSPDGRWVASGGYDNVVRIWDPETQLEVMPPLSGHTQRIRSIVFGADGQLLTASDDGTASLWDLGPALESLAAGSPVIETVPRQVFDTAPGNRARETVHAADLSPSGEWVATAGNDHYLRVWDARTGIQLAAESHPDSVMNVAFIDDKRLVSVCNDATIRFWELTTTVADTYLNGPVPADQARFLRPVASQRGHDGWIRDVAVSPDRRSIATAGNDGTARLWALPQGGEIAVLGGYGRGFYQCADFGWVDGRLVVYGGTNDGRLVAVDAWTEQPLAAWTDPADFHHDGDIRSVTLSPDGTRLVTAGGDQTAKVWDAVTGRPLFQWNGHQGDDGGTIYRARFSPDGKWIVTASNDGTAQVWSAEDGSPGVMMVPGNGLYLPADIIDPAALATHLAARDDPTAGFLWDHLSEEERATNDAKSLSQMLNTHVRGSPLEGEPAFTTVERRRKTRWLAKCAAGPISNRFLLDDALAGLVRRSHATVYDARFSEDGKRIVTADFDDQTATIWSASNGKRLTILQRAADPKGGHSDTVVSAAFSPDGRQVVTASTDGFCRVWQEGYEQPYATLAHNVAVRDASYSPDGRLILTAAVDGAARIWRTIDHLLRSELRGHTDTIPDASFSADGSYILTTSRDGTVRICHTRPWDLYALANQRITRKLTAAERNQFGVEREITPEEKIYYDEQSQK